jgi:hypothetical protein
MDKLDRHRLVVWKAITAHLLAFILTLGFFGIVFLSLTGFVDIKDPSIAQFVGTVTGYAIAKLERPLAFYFGVPRPGERADAEQQRIE